MIIIQLTEEELSNTIRKAVRSEIAERSTTSSQENKDDILTVEECADFLGLSKPSIYRLISQRAVPYHKRSKRCYFLNQTW